MSDRLDLPALMDRLLFPETERPAPIETANDDRYCTKCESLAVHAKASTIEGWPVRSVLVDCGKHEWRLRKHDDWLAAGRHQITLLLVAIGFHVNYFSAIDIYQAEDGTITGFTFPAMGLTFHQLDRISALFGTKKINWGQQDPGFCSTAAYDDIGVVEVLDPVLAAVG